MYETPQEKANIITQKVMRNMVTSPIMAWMLRIMGPNDFEARPILIVFRMARVKAMPQVIRTVAWIVGKE